MKDRPGQKIKMLTVDELLRVPAGESAVEIDIDKISAFENHPFKVLLDDRMHELVESVLGNEILTPVIVRPDDEDGYEMISGHRRLYAAKEAGLETIPAFVRELTDDQATIAMVDSNLQRETLLPSEKAFAYKMRYEAMRHQGNRGDLTSSQIGTKLPRADEIIAQDTGTSRNQVQRFIRLNELSEPLRDKVDNGELGFTPAVELSFLKPQEQEWVERALDETQQTPSLSQAQRIKQESKEGTLTEDTVHKIISEEKKPLYNSVTLSHDTLKKYFPKSYTAKQMENIIIRLLDSWLKKRQQSQER